ncbi:MAG: hypothetical protein GY694_08115 [Gammaproteobacteria bacterium]|nr:hypothetical protein [Gammaproteobacteria bacterium]
MSRILYLTAIIVILFPLIAAWTWYTEDDIGKVSLATKYMLSTYSKSDQKEMVEWLEKYHGEAPGHQVMLLFADWGISNPAPFVDLLRLTAPEVVERVTFAIYDGGMSKEFLRVFQPPESVDVSDIVKQVNSFAD